MLVGYVVNHEGKIVKQDDGCLVARKDHDMFVAKIIGDHAEELNKLNDEIEILKMKLDAAGWVE